MISAVLHASLMPFLYRFLSLSAAKIVFINGLLTLKRCINRKHSKIDLCANAQSFPNNDIAATPVPTAHQILELIKSRVSGFLSDFCFIANLISSPLIRSFCKVHWIEKLPQNPKILLQALSPKHQRWVGWLGV